MSKEIFSFVVTPTDSSVPLTLTVRINDQISTPPTLIDRETVIRHELDDQEGQTYRICLEMSGKTNEHTRLDQEGNIVSDALLEFKNFELMGVDINDVMCKNAVYHHNHNGNTDTVKQRFLYAMGCNGTVEFEFTTPIYMWLLENL